MTGQPETPPRSLTRRPVGRWRALLQNLTLSAVSVLLLAGLLYGVELALRAAAPSSGDVSADSVYDGHVYSERLGWVPRPGAVFAVGGARTTINALGYRGPAVAPGDARHSKIVVLGDSVAFGYGVADEDTFSARLDALLAETDVVNLAVPGYGVDQDLLRFEAEGQAYRPALVLLNVCLANDLVDIMLPSFLYHDQHPKPFFRLSGGGLELHDEHLRLGWRQRAGLRLREHSYAYRRLRAWFAPFADADPSATWVERRRRALADENAAQRLMLALIARLRLDVERNGGELMLVVHPTKETYRLHESWWNALEGQPELAGLRVLDPSVSYHAAGLGFGALALDELGHLNQKGHRLAALALRDEIARTGALATRQAAGN